MRFAKKYFHLKSTLMLGNATSYMGCCPFHEIDLMCDSFDAQLVRFILNLNVLRTVHYWL